MSKLIPTSLDDWYAKNIGRDDMAMLLTKAEYIQGQEVVEADLPLHGGESMKHLIYFRGWVTDGNGELLMRFALYRHGQEHVRKLEEVGI